jgi:hypothetical protein
MLQLEKNSGYSQIADSMEQIYKQLDACSLVDPGTITCLGDQIEQWKSSGVEAEDRLDIELRFSLLKQRIEKPLPAIRYKDVIGPLVLLALTFVGLGYLQTKGIS